MLLTDNGTNEKNVHPKRILNTDEDDNYDNGATTWPPKGSDRHVVVVSIYIFISINHDTYTYI